MAQVSPIPAGFHTITPSIIVKDSKKAVEFYTKAFGAQLKDLFEGPGGKVMHAEVQIGDSVLMFCDEMPEMGALSPTTLKGATASLYLYVPDADAACDRAVKAGAQVKMPIGDMFWGDRCGSVVDPFGHQWTLATRKENLTPEQTRQRGAEFFAAMAGKCS